MTRAPSRILVTGGRGFLGRHLVAALLRAGHVVHNLDFHDFGFSHPRLAHWAGSFTDEATLRAALTGVDAVFHLAATGFVREASHDPHRDCADNIAGTLRLIDLAAQAGVRRIVYASSGGTVYGPAIEVPLSENHPTNPITPYGISKLACEKYLRYFDGAGRIETLSLRIANPYGPGQSLAKAQGALTTFCKRAVDGEVIEIWGDGTVERDFIAVADVTRAFLAALSAPAHGVEINVGSGQGTSLNAILRQIERALGRPVARRHLEGRAFDVPRNHLCIARAERLMGWRPEVPLSRGIAELIHHFRAERAGSSDLRAAGY